MKRKKETKNKISMNNKYRNASIITLTRTKDTTAANTGFTPFLFVGLAGGGKFS